MRLRSALLIASALAASSHAMAQRGGLRSGGAGGLGGGAAQEVRQACGVDLRAYCAGVQPGGGRIAQCIRENWAKLTPACQKTILAMRGGAASTPGSPASASPSSPAAPAASANTVSPPG